MDTPPEDPTTTTTTPPEIPKNPLEEQITKLKQRLAYTEAAMRVLTRRLHQTESELLETQAQIELMKALT